jgi:hypothetical protein
MFAYVPNTERMKTMKRIRYLSLLMIAVFVLSGCNMIKVNEERDGAQIVAVVNGENITKKEVYVYAGLSWDTKVESWNLDTVKNEKTQALESLITNKVILMKAKELGFYNFTADEQKEIDSYVSTITKSTYDTALKKYQDAAKTDSSIKPEEKANADVDTYLKSLGYTREKLTQEKKDSTAYSKLEKSITDKVTVKDTDVKTEYDTLLKSQQTSYATDPTQAVSDDNGSSSSSTSSTSTVVVYIPTDGFFRVRQIMIPLPTDVQSKISTDRTTKTDASIKEANDLLKTELAKIVDKANEALTKAKAANGDLTKLDQLIKDYGDNDPGMDTKTDGYLVCKDTTAYVTDFTNAALALTTVGTPSELVATDYGYHIIWITKKLAKGAIPYDDVKTALTELVKSTQQSTAWSNAVSGYVSDYQSKITEYTGRLYN